MLNHSGWYIFWILCGLSMFAYGTANVIKTPKYETIFGIRYQVSGRTSGDIVSVLMGMAIMGVGGYLIKIRQSKCDAMHLMKKDEMDVDQIVFRSTKCE